MLPIELAVLGLFLFVGFVGYCLGRTSARSDAQLERMFEQRRRDDLARAFLDSAVHVVPMRRREYRDGAA